MSAQNQPLQWHIHRWGTWGWFETAVKAVGIATGLIAFTVANSDAAIELTNISDILTVGLLGLLTLVVLGALVLRITQREIISLVFSITNMLGHAGMLYYVIFTPDENLLPVIFGLAYVFGELIKQRFLIITGYTESGAETPQMLMFSRGLMVAYILFAIVAVF